MSLPKGKRPPSAKGAAGPDRFGWRDIHIREPIPRLIPGGGISMISGSTGVGKTAFLATLIQRMLTGQSVLGFPPAADLPFIGYIGTDRRWETAKYWFDLAGVKEGPRFRSYCLLDDPDFNWREARKENSHAEMFADAIRIIDPPAHSLMIFDPIALYMGRRLGDYSETAAAIGELNSVCVRMMLNVIGTAHVKKATQDKKDKFLRPQDRILGTTAIASYTNTQIYMVGPEETEKSWSLVGYVSHNLPPAEFKFMRDDSGLFIPYSQDTAARKEAEDVIEEVEKDSVYATLPEPGEEPMATKNIVAFSGKSRSVVYERLKRWHEQGLLERVAEGLWRKIRRAN